jgi:predicted kinase
VNKNWKTAIVSRDTIRENSFTQPYIYTKQNEQLMTDLFNRQITLLLNENWNIVLDNTHASQYWLAKQLEATKHFDGYTTFIKFFDVPLWKALWRVWRRQRKTGKVVPKKVVKDMHKSYKKIDRQLFKLYES